MLSLCISVYGGKNVIANSNVTVSPSQVSLTETEELKSRDYKNVSVAWSSLIFCDIFQPTYHEYLWTDLQRPLETCLSLVFALGVVFGLKINHLEEFVKP